MNLPKQTPGVNRSDRLGSMSHSGVKPADAAGAIDKIAHAVAPVLIDSLFD